MNADIQWLADHEDEVRQALDAWFAKPGNARPPKGTLLRAGFELTIMEKCRCAGCKKKKICLPYDCINCEAVAWYCKQCNDDYDAEFCCKKCNGWAAFDVIDFRPEGEG